MDYSKLSTATLKKMKAGEKIDYSALPTEDLLVLRQMAQTSKPSGPSMLESGLRGAAQGASFGFADEITGGLEAAFTDKTYEQARDESRAAYEKAQEANPGTYLAGDVGASLATSLIPGLGVAKGASTLARMGKAAALGATAGAGYSDANTLAGVAGDSAAGAALGGAFQGVGDKVVSPALNKLTDTKWLGRTLANVPEEATERYINRAQQVNSALEWDDIGTHFRDDVMPNMQQHVSKLDGQAWQTLGTDAKIPKSVVLQAGQNHIDDLIKGRAGTLTRTTGTGADADAILAMRRQLAEIAEAYGDNLSESDLKSVVQNLQKLGWTLEGSPKSSIQGKALQELSGVYNALLKGGNGNYASAMAPVAEGTRTLQSASRQFVNQQAPEEIDKFLRTAKRLPKLTDEAEAVKSLRGIDKSTGAGIEDMIRDRTTFDAFERPDTNGSRRTLAGQAVGKIAGMALGGAAGYEAGGEYGAGAGALAGFSMDRHAGKVFKQMLNGKLQADKVIEQLAPKLGKYAQPLMSAAQRSSRAFAATHFILSQRDPEYRKTIEGLDLDEAK